jgi:hypothetical protein
MGMDIRKWNYNSCPIPTSPAISVMAKDTNEKSSASNEEAKASIRSLICMSKTLLNYSMRLIISVKSLNSWWISDWDI